MHIEEGWIGSWSPGIGDPTPIGWLTVGFYILAAWLCHRVLRSERARLIALDPMERRLWRLLVLTLVFLGINKQLDLQSAMTEIGIMLAKQQGWYAMRGTVQVWFIALLGLAVVVTIMVTTYLLRRTPMATRIALSGSIVLMGFVLVRAASFHRVDAFLLSTIGGMRMNWILEVGGLIVISMGARKRAQIR